MQRCSDSVTIRSYTGRFVVGIIRLKYATGIEIVDDDLVSAMRNGLFLRGYAHGLGKQKPAWDTGVNRNNRRFSVDLLRRESVVCLRVLSFGKTVNLNKFE